MTKTAEIAHLFRALKAPAAARALPKLSERAREESWSYERFAEALLSTEVASRESHGGESRIKAARFPARKTLEEFDFTFQRSVKKQVVEHLGQLDFLHARENVVLLGPPGTGKTHLAIAISIRACLAGQRVAFATATEWVARLGDAKRQGSLEAELRRLSFVPLIVVDEVGYIPFDPEAANLMFSLVSARYERASMIVTSNKPFSGWGEIFGDEVTATAMIDRLVHHAEILSLKGDSYRLRDKRAKRVWGLTENPASAEFVERPRITYTGEFDTLDRDEIELLAASAANAQDAAIYKVAAYTGLRQGELLALRWSSVDFVDGLLHVRANFTDGRLKIPKGKRVRSVPMMPEVMDTLARLKEREHFTDPDDLVFCSEVGGYLGQCALRRRFYAALDRAGLRRVRFHDLRHAFGSAAITKLDPYAVQSYMGHQHYQTTTRYLHHKPRREDAAALAEAFATRSGETHQSTLSSSSMLRRSRTKS